jgi:dTDP-4-dehydrorhamnose reductase
VSAVGPVAVTGATGRLGRAVLKALASRQMPAVAWSRPEYDLDNPHSAPRLMERDRPSMVIHSAAWTDPDGCVKSPELAMRRNATSVAEIAAACTRHGASLVLVSTNEVFDGRRTDGCGYTEEDAVNPINPYGATKLAGERIATAAFNAAGSAGSLTIVRTAWLYGPPGGDFPTKILGAARRLPANGRLRVVFDEVGSPTFTEDLANSVLDLVERGQSGVYHLTNEGRVSRLDAAKLVLSQCQPVMNVEPISRTAFVRASTPPAWAVLNCARAAGLGIRLRPWTEPLEAYARHLCA